VAPAPDGTRNLRNVVYNFQQASELFGGCLGADLADPWGGQRAIFTAEGTLNREDWGLTWNMPLEGGGLLVSTDIRIEINTEAVLQP